MKAFLTFCMIAVATSVWADDSATAPAAADAGAVKKAPAAKKKSADKKKAAPAPDVHVEKAVGDNAKTVAEVTTNGAALKDKIVLIRGKVVKYNSGIMGRNWVHLRDGSGVDADETNDILVTTMDSTNVGEIVTAKGVVHTNVDFGAGYSYKVMLEEGTLTK